MNKLNIYIKKQGYRAGVIIYTKIENEIYFLLGIDKITREYSDFGGGIKVGETIIDTAYRELMEESCNIFKDIIKKEDLEKSIILSSPGNENNLFIYKIDKIDKNIIIEEFNKRNNIKNELYGIKWLNKREFKEITYNKTNKKMCKKIKYVYKKYILGRIKNEIIKFQYFYK